MVELKTVETVDTSPFKKLVVTIGELPTSFVESMTYYELLAWFTNYLQNTIIPAVNNNGEAVIELQEKFVELKTFVDTYFDNLDVQEEINNKLDEMAEDGTLEEIMADYIQAKVSWVFDNVAEMKASENLINGSYATTLGYYNKGDGGGGTYYIDETGTADEGLIIAIGDSLKAHLVTDKLNIKQFGAKGDGETDDSLTVKTALSTGLDLLVPAGTYLVDLSASTYDYAHLTGENKDESVLVFTAKAEIKDLNLNNLTIKGGSTFDSLFAVTDSSERNYYIENCYFDGDNKVDYFISAPSTSNNGDCIIKDSTFTKFNKCGVEIIGEGNYFLAENCNFNHLGSVSSTKTRAISLGSTTDANIKWAKSYVRLCNVDTLTTADSTGNDSVECQAIRIRGGYVNIDSNSISNIIGKGQDHEGIYVKAETGQITNNRLINCGHGNGAITVKPLANGVISGNIVNTTGCCIYSRGENLLVVNNKFNSDLTDRTSYQYDDSASFNAVVLSEGYTKFVDNEVSILDPVTRSENTSAIKVEINASDLYYNKISADQTTFVITFNSNVNDVVNIKGNTIISDTTSYLIRNVVITTGFGINFEDNTVECGTNEFESSASGGNSIKQLLFKNNVFKLDNFTGSTFFTDSNINASSNLVAIDNMFTSKTNKTITNLCQVRCNAKFISNRVDKVVFSRFFFIANNISTLHLETNEINGVAMRMNTAVTCDTVIVKDNFITGSNMFTTNMLTATTAYILNNMMSFDLELSYLTATNLYNKGNVNYTA